MTLREFFILTAAVFDVLAFLLTLGYLVRARDPRCSMGKLLLAGPLLFIHPKHTLLKAGDQRHG